MNSRASLIALLLLLLAFAPVSGVRAADAPKCVVCGRSVKPGETYYNYQHPTLKKEVFICADCNKLKQHCSKCGLPVLENAEHTGDGRYFCSIDFPLVALDENEIRKIFASASVELVRISSGKLALRNQSITLNVFDVDYWNKKIGERQSSGMQRHGLSTSRPVGNGLVHTVLVYRGLFKDEMVAVCAHEYTHLWINENKPENRNIEPQTIEAICEVVALALMEKLQMNGQVQAIMQNGYTEGRIDGLAKFYKVHGLNRVLDWVVDGVSPTINERDFQVNYSSPQTTVTWQPPPPAYRAEFTRLQLKGVLGNKEKAVALINDKTFVKGEERKMDLGSKKISVKLLEIDGDSVLLQVEGAKEPVKLSRE